MSDPLPAGAQPGNRTVMIVLSYLWLLALIPLVVEKNDRDVQWHAKHGLVLLVAEIVLWVALFMVQTVLGHIPFLGCLLGLLGLFVAFVLWCAVILVHVMCIVKGVNGQRFIIPYVSQYADQF